MKSTLLSNVSHEIRTPLASVRSYSEILLNYDDLDRDTQKEFLGIILEESKRLNFLVNDVLDVLKLDSGKFELQAARVDMAEVMATNIS
jgi:signal transduction histidine kinase